MIKSESFILKNEIDKIGYAINWALIIKNWRYYYELF